MKNIIKKITPNLYYDLTYGTGKGFKDGLLGVIFIIMPLLILTFFFEGMLEYTIFFWMPEAWGSFNDDGEWVSTKSNISRTIGFIVAMCILGSLYNSIRRRIEKWEQSNE